MQRTIRILFIIFFSLTFLFRLGYAQESSIKKNWMIGASGGVSYLVTELQKNFKGSYVEMNSLASGAYSFQVAKAFNYNFDGILEYNRTYFNGYKQNPTWVNWLMHSSQFNNGNADFQPFPIEYHTNMSTFYGKIKYHLSPFYSYRQNYTNTNMYLTGGVGWTAIEVKLAYTDPSNSKLTGLGNPIFSKGGNSYTPKSTYVAYTAGAGLRHLINPHLSVDIEVCGTLVDADYLDGVHNFSRPTTSAEFDTNRIMVYDIVGSLVVGVTYQFDLKLKKNNVSSGSEWQKKKKGFNNERYHDKSNRKMSRPELPFSR